MKLTLSLIILSILLFSKCKHSTDLVVIQTICFDRALVDESKFVNKSTKIQQDVFYQINQNKLIFIEKEKNKIIYDVSMKKIINDINELEYSPYLPIFVLSYDTIYFFNYKKNLLVLLDSAGEIKKQWNIHLDSSYLYNSCENMFVIYNNICYIKCLTKNFNMADSHTLKTNYFNYPYLYGKITNDSILKINTPIGKYPFNYRIYFYYDLCSPHFCKISNNHFVLSYSSSDSIYIYEGAKLLKTISIKSKHDKGNFTPFDLNKIMDQKYIFHYLTCEPSYVPIVYNFHKNQYYRAYKRQNAYFNKEKKIETDNMNWSIIILNSQFEIINEIDINPQQYPYTPVANIIPTKNGFLLIKNNQNTTAVCYDEIKYD